MKKTELITRLEETTSLVDFYRLKPEILAALGGEKKKTKKEEEIDG